MLKKHDEKQQLHLTFVAMLFALAIGQVAVDFSRLISYQSISSQNFWPVAPAYFHLFLAFTVISTSWVGWRNSDFSGTNIQDVFSLDYIELVVDVVLVFMYFVLAHAAEIPNSPAEKLSPNASFEAKTVAIIISTYAFWDIVSCRTNFKKKFTQRLWGSIICTIISWYLVVIRIGGSGTVLAVLLADVSLILLIFTFRAMKRKNLCEHNIASWLLIGSLLALVHIFSVWSTKL